MNYIIHRDIKPENLVLDERGYLRITDFGIAKVYQKINGFETSGTPGYMSPEVIVGHNHSQIVDFFAVGVLTYEFMMGTRPFTGKNRHEIKEKIILTQFFLGVEQIPEGWSNEAADFINKLLQRKPANRLGLQNPKEVNEHPWIKNYPWKDLYLKRITPPYVPKEGDIIAVFCSPGHGMIKSLRCDFLITYVDSSEVSQNMLNVPYTFTIMGELFIPNLSYIFFCMKSL